MSPPHSSVPTPYTIACAYSAFEEDLKGSLETGKLADVVVLSKDILACPDGEILDGRVDLTVVGGEVLFPSHIVGGPTCSLGGTGHRIIGRVCNLDGSLF